jgi:hypothetical protein
VDFFDAHGLAGEDRAEIDFFLAQTDAAATRDHDGFIVEGIVNVSQAAQCRSWDYDFCLCPLHFGFGSRTEQNAGDFTRQQLLRPRGEFSTALEDSI